MHSQTEPSQSLPLEDNFIVDGFDFSTGVSICLAMDEELEDSGENGVDGTAELFKRMQTTADSPQGESSEWVIVALSHTSPAPQL